jgi:hypothetical protein
VTTGPGIQDRDHFDRLCVLLETIDEAHAGQSGSLLFGGAAQGLVAVQSGRVCWASSPMTRSRLTDRLRHACTVGDHELQLVFRDCRANGQPFGETLVAKGIVTFDVLREALLEHNAETLLNLAGLPLPEWRPGTIEQYDRALTFSSAELLAHSADGWWGPLAAEARSKLQAALRDRNATGLSFLRTPRSTPGETDSIVPVGFVGMEDFSAGELLGIGRAAARAIQACAPVAGQLVASMSADGRATLLWVDGGAYYVASCKDRSEMAFLIAHLSRRAPE